MAKANRGKVRIRKTVETTSDLIAARRSAPETCETDSKFSLCLLIFSSFVLTIILQTNSMENGMVQVKTSSITKSAICEVCVIIVAIMIRERYKPTDSVVTMLRIL